MMVMTVDLLFICFGQLTELNWSDAKLIETWVCELL